MSGPANGLLGGFRRVYGTGPAHLVLLLGGLALAGLTVHTLGLAELWDREVWWQSIAVWFVGAVLLHDVALLAVYTSVDRVLVRTVPAPPPEGHRPADGPSLLNHVRVALLAVGLVSLLFFPGVLRQGADSYLTATGMTQDPFALRWALLCAAIVLASAASYLVRRRRASVSGRRRR